ncbi:hypothetical protein, partial [Enterococcus faecalis]|uniref:hypothetical protein n=1 Tax=Enterococcus faecalis TaxID=1351 RepID=UPI003D6BD093
LCLISLYMLVAIDGTLLATKSNFPEITLKCKVVKSMAPHLHIQLSNYRCSDALNEKEWF